MEGRGVYLTASEHEEFGLSIVEAMAAGLIVVCRDIAPLNDLVTRGETGWHLAFTGGRSDRQIVDALLSMTGGQSTIMRRAAALKADQYQWLSRARVFVDHYAEVLDQGRPVGAAARAINR